MIAKLITWGETREEARIRMIRALREFLIEGIKTNIPLHLRILEHPDFLSSRVYTKWIEEELLKGQR
jgi:acetyl-CoA carboxylase biotin carboxylase subunit